jgi:hypothetical protein
MTNNQKNTHFSLLINKTVDFRSESGIGYVMVLLILVLMSSLSLAFLAKVGTETSATMKRGDGMQASYLAETAANHAMWRLLNDGISSIDIRVGHNYDDAVQNQWGNMEPDIDRMEIGTQLYGAIRFLNVAIPQGAAIASAYIDVKSLHTHSENTDITIRGEDADDTATFTWTQNDISSRAQTTASVTWNISQAGLLAAFTRYLISRRSFRRSLTVQAGPVVTLWSLYLNLLILAANDV